MAATAVFVSPFLPKKQPFLESHFWQEIITLTRTILRGYEICHTNFTSTLLKLVLKVPKKEPSTTGSDREPTICERPHSNLRRFRGGQMKRMLPFPPIFVFQFVAVVAAVVEAVVAVGVAFWLSDSGLHQLSSCSLLVAVDLNQK